MNWSNRCVALLLASTASISILSQDLIHSQGVYLRSFYMTIQFK